MLHLITMISQEGACSRFVIRDFENFVEVSTNYKINWLFLQRRQM